MIIESIVLLGLILMMGLFFNRRIKQMTPSRSIHRQRRHIRPQTSTREIGTTHATPHLEPLDSHALRKDYVNKISKTDPKAIAAMITHWTKNED